MENLLQFASQVPQFFISIFWFLLILVPIIGIHEFGHLLISRAFGVKIPEYAIGMPLVKRTFYKRWKGIIWSFYWPVLGGFVRIYGDNDAIDEAHDIAKTDPVAAREQYKESRFQEIVANRELQFFLEDNSLIYDQKWMDFENSKYAKGQADASADSVNEKLYEQLITLIDWEYDQQIKATNTFFSKNWLQKTFIIFGGIIFNLITAVVVFWGIFTFAAMPLEPISLVEIETLRDRVEIVNQGDNLLAGVVTDSFASQIGMETGDRLVSFAGVSATEINTQTDFTDLVRANQDEEIEVTYLKSSDNTEVTERVTVTEGEDGRLLFGVSLFREIEYKAKGPVSAVNLALENTYKYLDLNFRVLGRLALAPFPNQDRTVLQAVSGPIGISAVSGQVFDLQGPIGILRLVALISVGLAVFNMLPIPALDGGRWVIITINSIRGKRNRKLEATLIGVTFIAMLVLAAVIAVKDIQTWITGGFNIIN